MDDYTTFLYKEVQFHSKSSMNCRLGQGRETKHKSTL